ncbi:hypothetical protein IWZ03DRAFT_14968 [Phyllosticta citriasiana]|uniref:Uncharacterized protein n=1 Tax=Phyllosticta citriasiana TaxID=595635 RepID=A0ABR1L2T5_9PEZI
MACGCVNYLVCRLSSSYYKHGTVQVLCYPSLLLRYSALVRFGLVKKHTTNLCSLPQGKQASRQASNVTSTCASCCCCHCHYTQTWVSPPLAGCLGPQLATGLSSTIHLFASLHSRMRPSYIRPSVRHVVHAFEANQLCMHASGRNDGWYNGSRSTELKKFERNTKRRKDNASKKCPPKEPEMVFLRDNKQLLPLHNLFMACYTSTSSAAGFL